MIEAEKWSQGDWEYNLLRSFKSLACLFPDHLTRGLVFPEAEKPVVAADRPESTP